MFVSSCLSRLFELSCESRLLVPFLCSLLFFQIALFLLIKYREQKRLPPGPWGLPILGYLPFLRGNDVHTHFGEMASRFGSIFSMRLGSQLMVVLSDPKEIRAAFRKEEFTGRPTTEFSSLLEGYGVINIDGSLWKDQRRFLHGNLRHFGMKQIGTEKEQLEARVMKEVECFLETVASSREMPLDLSPPLATSVSNVICSMLMSTRFEQGDPGFRSLMDNIEEGFRIYSNTAAINFIPVLRHLPKFNKGVNKLRQNRADIGQFFQQIIDEHKSTFDPSKMRDIVDAYLLEIQQAKEEGRADQLFNGKDHDRQIQQILGDLFSAGMETVKTTLQWAVVYTLRDPEIQKNVQAELDLVVGRQRLPALSDLPQLTYTESVILEVFRRSSVVPLGTTHSVTSDMDLGGFHIPREAHIVPLLHAVHMSPDLWEEPEKFNPTRFIDESGRIHKPDYFMPFGVGRRMCLGDLLARMEVFLFFSSLLHVFHLEVPSGHDLPNCDGIPGITITPEPFEVRAIPRHLEISNLNIHHRFVGTS